MQTTAANFIEKWLIEFKLCSDGRNRRVKSEMNRSHHNDEGNMKSFIFYLFLFFVIIIKEKGSWSGRGKSMSSQKNGEKERERERERERNGEKIIINHGHWLGTTIGSATMAAPLQEEKNLPTHTHNHTYTNESNESETWKTETIRRNLSFNCISRPRCYRDMIRLGAFTRHPGHLRHPCLTVGRLGGGRRGWRRRRRMSGDVLLVRRRRTCGTLSGLHRQWTHRTQHAGGHNATVSSWLQIDNIYLHQLHVNEPTSYSASMAVGGGRRGRLPIITLDGTAIDRAPGQLHPAVRYHRWSEFNLLTLITNCLGSGGGGRKREEEEEEGEGMHCWE